MNTVKKTFNKAIYITKTIFDLSKELLYYFHISVMKLKYGEKIEVMNQPSLPTTYRLMNLRRHGGTSDYPTKSITT